MEESNWLANLRSLFDASTIGYLWFTVIALWGGTASYISRMEKRGLPFSLAELIGEWVISGFSGVATALICVNLNVSFELTAAASGIAGHMGGRAIAVLESLWLNRAKGQ